MKKPYKVAFVSAGMITNAAHIPAYKHLPDAFTLSAICDLRHEAAQETAARHGIPGVYTDYEKMLREVEPDIVSVCTPNLYHPEQTIVALNHGAHVVCEKPLALKYADAKRIFAAAKAAGRQVFPCQSLRYTNEFFNGKAICDTGVLGDIYYGDIACVRRRGVPTWGMFHMMERSGGGAFCDIGVHMMDSLVWLSGNKRLSSISGTTTTRIANRKDQLITSLKDSGAPQGVFTPRPYDYREFNVEEFAAGSMRFQGGMSVNFKIAWALNHPDTFEFRLIGDEGGLSIPDMKVYGHLGAYQADIAARVFDDSLYAGVDFYGHWHLIERMLQTLEGEAPPLVTEAEALNVVAILDGFYRSAKAGREMTMAEIERE